MKRVFNRVCVVGLGYIGLPTAAMFASRKIKVIGVDINLGEVDSVRLHELLRRATIAAPVARIKADIHICSFIWMPLLGSVMDDSRGD